MTELSENFKDEMLKAVTTTTTARPLNVIRENDGVIIVNPKEKLFDITDVKGARTNISDIKIFGNGDTFELICKESSNKQGWMKSTKACEIVGIGCIVQVTTQQKNPDGSYAVAEALTFVPGIEIAREADLDGKIINRKLIKI